MASNKEEGEATTDLKQHEENGTKSNDKEESSSIHLKKVSFDFWFFLIFIQNVFLSH